MTASIYIASKATHGHRWRAFRASGVPIISTWIDECGQGETADWPGLWERCIREAASASALVLYRQPEETLKGAFVELGAALAAGRPVFAVGLEEFTVRHHPGVELVLSINFAFARAMGRCGPWPAKQ